MTLFVLCAPAGAGKTTLSKQLVEDNNAILHCFDEYPGALRPHTTQMALNSMLNNIAEDIKKSNVVVDNLNVKVESREEILKAVEGIECKKVLVVVRASLEECLERNRKRNRQIPDQIVRFIYRDFQEPTLEEGWDEIIYC